MTQDNVPSAPPGDILLTLQSSSVTPSVKTVLTLLLHLLHSEPRSTKVLHLIPANTKFLLWTKPWEFRGSQAPSGPLTPRPSARRTELDPSDTRGLHNLSCLGCGARERTSGGLGWPLREVGDKTGLWGKLSCKRQNKDNKLGPDCEEV